MIMLLMLRSVLFACGFRYVLGAVETFLKAVPAAGIFKGKINHGLQLKANFDLSYL